MQEKFYWFIYEQMVVTIFSESPLLFENFNRYNRVSQLTSNAAQFETAINHTS